MVSIDWNIWFIEFNVYPGSLKIEYLNHNQKVSDSRYTTYLIINITFQVIMHKECVL